MSNDLVALIQNNPALIETGLDEDSLAVAGGSRGNNKRISIDGGVFRKIVNGKEIGSIEDRHMNIIFVKMSHDPARNYYASAFQKGVKASPVCWSSNSKTPDAGVKTPMSDSCSNCEKSIKGSGNGGMGTACRLSWRTAIVLPNDPSGDVMQFVIPATSCFGDEDNGRWPFRPYVQMLVNNNVSASRVITKMQFDTKASVPRVIFSAVGAVQADDYAIVRTQGQSQAAENAVKLTVFQSDEPAAPAAPVHETVDESLHEPVLRESDKSASASATEATVTEVIKKWTKKK